jgi:CBS domain-containing protein
MKTIGEILGDRAPFQVEPGLSVGAVVDYLCDKGIGAVAVCEGTTIVGVFSERDLMRRVVAKGLDPQRVPVSEVMTKEVLCVGVDDTSHTARTLMFARRLRHLAVVDGDAQFKGFVSMREILEVDLAESKDLIEKLNDDYYHYEFKVPEKKTFF